MNDFFEAFKALYLFKPYTDLPRWVEILYGILAWLVLSSMIYSWFN